MTKSKSRLTRIVRNAKPVTKVDAKPLQGRQESRRSLGAVNSRKKKDGGWVELFPYGVSFSMGGLRPVLILKSEDNHDILPVWMNPIDAGMAMADSNVSRVQHTPHKLSLNIMQNFGLLVKECRFVGIQGNQQFVELRVEGKDECQVISARASEAMSFCLNAKAKFFASKEVILASRDLNEDAGPIHRTNAQVTKKTTTYLM